MKKKVLGGIGIFFIGVGIGMAVALIGTIILAKINGQLLWPFDHLPTIIGGY